MKPFLQPALIKNILLPLLGAAGAVVAMTWPIGYRSFCNGIAGFIQ